MFLPLRLHPGADLRQSLEACLAARSQPAAFVVAGIGSLSQARIRYADQEREVERTEPLELLTLAGSISPQGAHLHMAVSTGTGEVLGGHVAYGNIVRTTAEVLLAFLPDWQLAREHDAATGYAELVVRSRPKTP